MKKNSSQKMVAGSFSSFNLRQFMTISKGNKPIESECKATQSVSTWLLNRKSPPPVGGRLSLGTLF
jgi:hypothetical protein